MFCEIVCPFLKVTRSVHIFLSIYISVCVRAPTCVCVCVSKFHKSLEIIPSMTKTEMNDKWNIHFIRYPRDV